MNKRKTKYWVVVASKDHVKNGIKAGIAQASHGKKPPLQRMQVGDFILYYSGKQIFGKADKCQEFTGIGKIADEEIFQVQISDTFTPWRRKVDFLKNKDISILPLIEHLEFIKNKKSWGFPFRFGFFEIQKDDFELISNKMLLHNGRKSD